MIRIATFYSHFGAVSFKKSCDAAGVPARLMPVPRSLSSSCGTCVRFESEIQFPGDAPPEDAEQLVDVLPDGSFRPYWGAED